MTTAKVSIIMVTYNQEAYIEEAIDSVLMQNLKCDYKLIIGDDHSTDNTINIIKKYKDDYPDRITLVRNEKNLGSKLNFINLLIHCDSPYIAILDGDDYWCDKDKLQKELDVLNSNTESSVVFHPVFGLDDESGKIISVFEPNPIKSFYTFNDILHTNFIQSCSVMFKNKGYETIDELFQNLYILDWPLHIYNAHGGKISYINKRMAVYRIHNKGVWSSRITADNVAESARVLEEVNRYYKSKYYNDIRGSLISLYCEASIQYKRHKKNDESLRYLHKAGRLLSFKSPFTILDYLYAYLTFHAPLLDRMFFRVIIWMRHAVKRKTVRSLVKAQRQ